MHIDYTRNTFNIKINWCFQESSKNTKFNVTSLEKIAMSYVLFSAHNKITKFNKLDYVHVNLFVALQYFIAQIKKDAFLFNEPHLLYLHIEHRTC